MLLFLSSTGPELRRFFRLFVQGVRPPKLLAICLVTNNAYHKVAVISLWLVKVLCVWCNVLLTHSPNSAPHLTYFPFAARLFVKEKSNFFAVFLLLFLKEIFSHHHFWHQKWTLICQLADHHLLLALSTTILIFKRVADFKASTAFLNSLSLSLTYVCHTV